MSLAWRSADICIMMGKISCKQRNACGFVCLSFSEGLLRETCLIPKYFLRRCFRYKLGGQNIFSAGVWMSKVSDENNANMDLKLRNGMNQKEVEMVKGLCTWIFQRVPTGCF